MISSINATIEVEEYLGSEMERGAGSNSVSSNSSSSSNSSNSNSGSSSLIRSIYVALEPECRASGKGRDEGFESSIVFEDSRIRVTIYANDVSTIRAVLNSYLRFIDAAYRSLIVTK
ncbi:MAG: KEOPS complex subunit Pcc1 [Candidatus Nitrosocaldus sp.]